MSHRILFLAILEPVRSNIKVSADQLFSQDAFLLVSRRWKDPLGFLRKQISVHLLKALLPEAITL